MRLKKLVSIVLSLSLAISLCPTVWAAGETEDIHHISLSSQQGEDGWSHTATYDGSTVAEYDYTWHADPSQVHDDVKNVPGVWYTGTEPTGDEAVYIAHDISYYPELDSEAFVLQNYDGEREWCYYYTAEGYTDYLFSTLPVKGSELPEEMMHSADEAYGNAVLHITQPGTYSLTGDWHGQIWIDLGEDAFDDPSAKVKLILNGVDVTCTVAPALVFGNVYECDNQWEDQESWSSDVDTTDAGAVVVLADGTENNFSGCNIFRILKTTFKDSDAQPHTGAAQKKYLKIDAAFYSYMSMNIEGEAKGTGVLNVTSGFEGLDSELHLSFNGGNVNIQSQDDGVNVNEDGVSVVAVNGGSLHIVAGLGAEGDGIDSNGFLVINGGVVIACAKPNSDSGLDSDMGSCINGGYVVATGSTMDWAESDSEQVTMNLQFAASQASDEAIILTDTDGNVVFAYDPDKDETSGSLNRGYLGAVLSCPELEVGKGYYVYVGGDVYGTEVNGLYDASTVTGFSDEAVQQCYTGTDVNGFPGGMTPPDGEMPDMPEGFEPGQMPEGFQPGQRPEMPEGSEPGQRPEMPEGSESGQRPDMPEDFDPSQMGGFFQPGGQGAGGPQNTLFLMTDKVNAFSGVTDYTGFADVAADAYYADAVRWAVEEGITTGTDEASFSPDQVCTRAQAVTFLWRAAGSLAPVDSDMPFGDVAAESYYADAVRWALERGITTGTGADTFSPEEDCTRAQIITMLYRAAGSPAVSGDLTFADVAEADYYADAVRWAVAEGITNGTTETAFGPDEDCTRAQIVTFLHRAQAGDR